MSYFKTALLVGGVGPIYLLLVFVIGLAATRRWQCPQASPLERATLALTAGLLLHSAATAIALWWAPGWVGLALWVLAGVAAGSLLPKGMRVRGEGWAPVLWIVAYALVCMTLLLAAHYGPQRGATIFWTIYKLSYITPGDSPQAAFQAQYLLHGGQLNGMEGFALFDRPFLGGLITAGALGAFGISLGADFYQYSDAQALAYTSLWIALNASAALPLVAIAQRFATGPALRVAVVLLLASPFFVFNTIGLWPKLLALGILGQAGLFAVRQRYVAAALLSGTAFYLHGSYLWPHIALAGVMILACLFLLRGRPGQAWPLVAAVAGVAVAFPALWFAAEHLAGGASPLRTYYLYNVDVTYGFHHDAVETARQFYRSTNPENLAALPLMNLLKGFLPIELLTLVLEFHLGADPIHWRTVGQAWFGTQFFRMWYALCLTCAAVAFRGLFSVQGKRWLPRLALIAFMLLPLIPGTGLYRRDDHFLLNISMSAVLALLVFLCIGLQSLGARALHWVAGLALAEFALVFLSRYPAASSASEFRAFYVLAVLILLAVAAYLLFGARWSGLLAATAPETRHE